MQLLTRVKICGLCRPGDAAMAASLGADFLGIILAPGFRRSQAPESAERIWASAPGVARVGVFVDQEDSVVIGLARALELAIVQLHGDESDGAMGRVRGAGPWRIWKAVKPRSAEEFEAAVHRYQGKADGLLVDGFSPTAAGGTGIRFPWLEVARHRAAVATRTEFIMAGGLNPSNVAEAVATLAPDIVDVSSGVESEPGAKSAELLEAFFDAVRGAGRATGRDERKHG